LYQLQAFRLSADDYTESANARSINKKEKIMLKNGDIVKGSSPEIFLIDRQRRRWISDPTTLLFELARLGGGPESPG
jgi:hypothetical protein